MTKYKLVYRGGDKYSISRRYTWWPFWSSYRISSGDHRNDPYVRWLGTLDEAKSKVSDLKKIGLTIEV